MTNGSKDHFNLGKIHEAFEVFCQLVEKGYAPHCPQLSVYLELMFPHRLLYDDWLEIDMTHIALSDVVFRIPGPSAGADREVAFAIDQGIPVVHSFDELDAALALPSFKYGGPS
jgi:pentatricopeptide repeat protein